MRKLDYAGAIREATTQEMERDSRVFVYGIGVPTWSSIFGTTKGLPEAYWLDLTYLRDQLAAQVDWLARTIDRLESGELSWSADQIKNPQTREEPKDLS